MIRTFESLIREENTTLSYGDRSPTLAQILDERNPRLSELMAEQTISGRRAHAWCYHCYPAQPFATVSALCWHVRKDHS